MTFARIYLVAAHDQKDAASDRPEVPNHPILDDVSRLRAQANANAEDARMWRWLCDRMEDRSLEFCRESSHWHITFWGETVVHDPSFDNAMRLLASAMSPRR